MNGMGLHLGRLLRPSLYGLQPAAVQHAVFALAGSSVNTGQASQLPWCQPLSPLQRSSSVTKVATRSFCSALATNEVVREGRRGIHSSNSRQSSSAAGCSFYSKEAEVLFDLCWRKMEERYGQDFWAPREIVWLNGAPGSGKGANTPHILKVRGLNRAVAVSTDLANNPEAVAYMQRGDMVPEVVVADTLLDAVFNPDSADRLGLLVDGFPRTTVQVDFVKLLYEKLQTLHEKYVGTPFEDRFPRPSFKIIMLYVDEETSIGRQMQRAESALRHNKRVLDAGGDGLREQRATDMCVAKCQKRYEIFRTHYAALLDLKQQFPFTLIDAMCSIRGTEDQISRELRYQSSMDLHESTYAALRHIPVARDVVKSARQQLVVRLDSYCLRHSHLFAQVMNVVDGEVLSLLRRCGLAGNAEFITDDQLFDVHPMAIDMLIDILSDRGFGVHHAKENFVVPLNFDLQTAKIVSKREARHHFHITFNVKGLREVRVMKDGMSQNSLEAMPEFGITKSFIPTDEQQNQRVEAFAKAHQQAVWAHRLQTGWLSSIRGNQSSGNQLTVARG